jgi:hypothetical protein
MNKQDWYEMYYKNIQGSYSIFKTIFVEYVDIRDDLVSNRLFSAYVDFIYENSDTRFEISMLED